MPDVTDKAEAAASALYKALDNPTELAELTARALLSAAQSAARSRPTPQAPMVAAGFSVDNQAIRGPAGTLGELTMGAEFGSVPYSQFGSRHSRGSWLFPTLEQPPGSVADEQADWLERVTHG